MFFVWIFGLQQIYRKVPQDVRNYATQAAQSTITIYIIILNEAAGHPAASIILSKSKRAKAEAFALFAIRVGLENNYKLLAEDLIDLALDLTGMLLNRSLGLVLTSGNIEDHDGDGLNTGGTDGLGNVTEITISILDEVVLVHIDHISIVKTLLVDHALNVLINAVNSLSDSSKSGSSLGDALLLHPVDVFLRRCLDIASAALYFHKMYSIGIK